MTWEQDTDSSTRRCEGDLHRRYSDMSQLISDVHLAIATLRQLRLGCVGWCRQSGVSSYGGCSGGCELETEYGSIVVGLVLYGRFNSWMWYCGSLNRTIRNIVYSTYRSLQQASGCTWRDLWQLTRKSDVRLIRQLYFNCTFVFRESE